MNVDHARLQALFQEAVQQPADGRDAWIDRTCASDATAAAELRAMLAADAEPAGILEQPLQAIAGNLGLLHVHAQGERTGERIGPFHITALLGSGGMGTVYRAERNEGDFAQTVALKLMHAGQLGADAHARFLQERRILAQLTHPNIAHFVDGGIDAKGEPWFAMEYVRGEPLLSWCDAGRLPLHERLRLLLDVCGAVELAHSRLVIHRDIKPGNVLVDEARQVKLLDFGIAKLLDDSDAMHAATATNARLLTPQYATPEQVRGDPVTTATDIHALALLMYELLCGRRAFGARSSSPFDVQREVLEIDPPPMTAALLQAPAEQAQLIAVARQFDVRSLARQLRGDLQHIVAKALRKEPEQRYRTVAAFADDIRHYLASQPVAAAGGARSYRVRKFLRRHRVAVATATAVVLAVVVGLAGTLWQAHRANIEAERAEAVAGFLENLFRSADPRVGLKPDTRVADLLESATSMVHAQNQMSAQARVRLLLGIGRSLQSLAQYPQARTAFLEANQLAAVAHLELQRAEMAAALAYSNLEWGDSGYVEADEQSTDLVGLVDAGSPVAKALAHIALGFDASNQEKPDACELHLAAALQSRAELARFTPAFLPIVLLVRGENLTEMRQFEQARTVLRDALDMHERTFGPEHPQTLRARLGFLDNELSLQHLDIEAPVTQMIHSLQHVLGPFHHDTLVAGNLLGRLYLAQGRAADALAAFQSFSFVEHGADTSGFNVAIGHVNVGLTAWRLGRDDLAKSALESTLAAVPHEDANSEPAWNARAVLAEMACSDHSDPGAPERLRAMYADPAKPGDVDGLIGLALARCLRVVGHDDEAASLLTDVIPILRARSGERHVDTHAAQELLRDLRSAGAAAPQ